MALQPIGSFVPWKITLVCLLHLQDLLRTIFPSLLDCPVSFPCIDAHQGNR